MNKGIKLVQPEIEVPVEIMVEHIQILAKFGEKLKNSKLKQRAVLILLQDMTGLPIKTIQKVLDALPQMAKEYTK